MRCVTDRILTGRLNSDACFGHEFRRVLFESFGQVGIDGKPEFDAGPGDIRLGDGRNARSRTCEDRWNVCAQKRIQSADQFIGVDRLAGGDVVDSPVGSIAVGGQKTAAYGIVDVHEIVFAEFVVVQHRPFADDQ